MLNAKYFKVLKKIDSIEVTEEMPIKALTSAK